MRSVTWRRVVVGSASVAVTASLLVVPASVVSSSEPVEAATQQKPVAAVAEVSVESVITPRRDNSQIFGETLVRLKVSMGEDDPVARGKVLVTSVEGKLLLRGYTNAVGQVVFLTQQELPDRVVVRVKGGQSKGLKGDVIDLRAFFEPRDGEVVDVNPLTTMDELCRSGNYGTYCSTAVDSFYRLKGSVDYRDLVAISDRWFDGSRFGREAAKRGLTTWQWAERVLLKAYAGKQAPKVRANSERSDASPRSAAATAASWTFASVGSGLMRSAAGGIAGSLASRYFNKLMVAAGVFDPPPDLVGEIDSLRREMRSHFAEVQRGITDLKEGQAQIQGTLSNIFSETKNNDYKSAVRSFDEQDRRTRMNDVLESWKFWTDYVGCMIDKKQGCITNASAEAQAPRDLELCGRQVLEGAEGAVARGAVVLCAEFRRVLADYASRFTINGVRDRVLGAGEVNGRGLVALSQEVFARVNLNGILTSENQPAMMRAGAYWMGEWAKDKAIWAVITGDPHLVSRLSGGADTSLRQASELQSRYDGVAQDASGRHFPVRIPPGCTFAFYDMDTQRMYTRGFSHYYNLPGGTSGNWPLVQNAPRVPAELYSGNVGDCPWLRPSGIAPEKGPSLTDPWTSTPRSLVPRLSNAIAHIRRAWPERSERINFEDWIASPSRIGVGVFGEADGCYNLNLAEHLHKASGHVILCPFIDYGSSAGAQVKDDAGRAAMACVGADMDARIQTYTGVDQWTDIYFHRWATWDAKKHDLLTGCVSPWTRDRFFNGNVRPYPAGGAWTGERAGNFESSWEKCSRKLTFICTRTDKGPFKGAKSQDHERTNSIGGGHIKDFLPYYADRIPSGASPRKMSSWVKYSLLTMPYAGAVPGS